jgi:hypothetical protein
MERDTERGFVCCNVVMCAVVSGWWREREMERDTERGFVCCSNVGNGASNKLHKKIHTYIHTYMCTIEYSDIHMIHTYKCVHGYVNHFNLLSSRI